MRPRGIKEGDLGWSQESAVNSPLFVGVGVVSSTPNVRDLKLLKIT